MSFFEEYINDNIDKLKNDGLYRTINYIDSPQDSYVNIKNHRLLLLSSNNYMALCNDERLKSEATHAIKQFGCGSGGSRLTTGSHSKVY